MIMSKSSLVSFDNVFAKVATPIVILFAVGVTAIALVVPQILRTNIVDEAVNSAEATVHQFKTLRKYYTNNIIKKIVGKGGVKASFNHKDVDKTIPLPATMVHEVSNELSDSGTAITLYSEFPFPNRANRKLDDFSREAWTKLSTNPDQSVVLASKVDGSDVVRVAIADRMVSQACVNCHNSHPESPKTDWKLGDLRGVLEVTSNIDAPLQNGAATSRSIVITLVVLGLLILAAVYWLLQHRVSMPLQAAAAAADKMANGDLATDLDVRSNDEVGRLLTSLQAMQFKLTDVITEIKHTSDTVSSAAGEISQGNTNLSQRTEQQASNLQKTAASMEEMTSSVKQNADKAVEANRLSSEAQERAETGVAVVGDTVAAMDTINEASRRIADIISVIDEIAFQTNLLALNAAVEAARAGEQGRGFAVVASEVRNLAQRSATAAKEIKELIEDSVTKVKDGSNLVSRSGDTLEEIVTVVKQVSALMAEIAGASQEQSAGIEQVNQSVLDMDDMTHQNAALVEQSTAASEAMVGQAQSLNELIAYLATAEQGADDHRSASKNSRQTTPVAERRSIERPWGDSQQPDDASSTEQGWNAA